ncbi:MAG: hypothetical protein LUO89_02060 [Methanothrix sp.]|nr:hypothetical protein [Methanothrix sp.]
MVFKHYPYFVYVIKFLFLDWCCESMRERSAGFPSWEVKFEPAETFELKVQKNFLTTYSDQTIFFLSGSTKTISSLRPLLLAGSRRNLLANSLAHFSLPAGKISPVIGEAIYISGLGEHLWLTRFTEVH